MQNWYNDIMKKKFTISFAVILVIVIAVLWLFWGADTWNVQIFGRDRRWSEYPVSYRDRLYKHR